MNKQLLLILTCITQAPALFAASALTYQGTFQPTAEQRALCKLQERFTLCIATLQNKQDMKNITRYDEAKQIIENAITPILQEAATQGFSREDVVSHHDLDCHGDTILHDVLNPCTQNSTAFIQAMCDLFPTLLYATNNKGDLPLHTAIEARASKETIHHIITCMKNNNQIPSLVSPLNACNRYGNTALHLAAETRTLQELLIASNADPTIKNLKGEVPKANASYKMSF